VAQALVGAARCPGSVCPRWRAWLYRVRQGNMQELTAVASPIRRWCPWIVHVFRNQGTGGATEGHNNKIKRLKRMADGLSTFAYL